MNFKKFLVAALLATSLFSCANAAEQEEQPGKILFKSAFQKSPINNSQNDYSTQVIHGLITFSILKHPDPIKQSGVEPAYLFYLNELDRIVSELPKDLLTAHHTKVMNLKNQFDAAVLLPENALVEDLHIPSQRLQNIALVLEKELTLRQQTKGYK